MILDGPYVGNAIKPIHPFPARMAADLALGEIPELVTTPLRVLDPMVGSGTTLVAARLRGHEAIGFDTDPLAVLNARVWTSDCDEKKILRAAEKVQTSATREAKSLRIGSAFPSNADDETRDFIRYWFDTTNRKQLTSLSNAIRDVRSDDARQVLWCAFSRLIIAKRRGASRALDLSHSRPHLSFNKISFRPIPNFLDSLHVVLKNLPFKAGFALPAANIRVGDARHLAVPDESIDLVMTSPPYLNAIDYIRCSKFSLVWMGFGISQLRQIRSTNIGAEAMPKCRSWAVWNKVAHAFQDVARADERTTMIFLRYINDIHLVLGEIKRVLSSRGKCVMVIGDSSTNGIFVRNSLAVEELGKLHGLRTVSKRTRDIPESRRYLPPPSSNKAGESLRSRIRAETVLTLALT